VVICLHGWPYDIHSYADVAPLLAPQGYRVIVPYLRGHGTTCFLSARTFRNAQQSVIALDIIALMDALRIDKAVLAGFDWGSRTADIIAALWPERVKALVSVSGYLITSLAANLEPIAPKAEYAWWYQYYFATDRGEKAMNNDTDRHDLTRLVWDTVSPTWNFDDATFERTAAAFENPDYPAIVIHNYRWRLSLAAGERRYDHLEKQLAARPTIKTPTVVLDAELDPFSAGNDVSYRGQFTGPYSYRLLKGIRSCPALSTTWWCRGPVKCGADELPSVHGMTPSCLPSRVTAGTGIGGCASNCLSTAAYRGSPGAASSRCR
jgi:pimeloyl-ACP methyl ester carboxylesterase